MIPFRANRLTLLALALFFALIIGYTYFEARNVISGPAIVVDTAAEITTSEPLVIIRGVATNITELRMNERIIFTTESGAFEEAHLLAPGYNEILLVASDKMGRTTEKTIEMVYIPEAASAENENKADLQEGE